MLGRTPSHIRVVKPLKDGVIADFKVTEKMLSYFIQKAHQRRTLVHPRIVISIPSEVTQVEKRAVTDAAYRTKAASVHLVEQAMMAAIGAGLPVTEPGGNKVTSVSRAAKHFRKLASIVPSCEDTRRSIACRNASRPAFCRKVKACFRKSSNSGSSISVSCAPIFRGFGTASRFR